jgi:hypothetical protein
MDGSKAVIQQLQPLKYKRLVLYRLHLTQVP